MGHVTKFEVDADYLQKFKVENVGGEIRNELLVRSEELEEFNKHVVGKIEVTAKTPNFCVGPFFTFKKAEAVFKCLPMEIPEH